MNAESIELSLAIDPCEKLVLKPDLLAMVCFVSTLMLYSPNTSLFSDAPHGAGVLGLFVFPQLISCFVAAAVYFALSMREKKHCPVSPAVLFASSALYLLGMFGFVALLYVDAIPDYLGVMCGVMAGAGVVPIVMTWGFRFAMPLRNALFCGSLVCGLASLVAWVLSFLSVYPKIILFAVLMVIGVVVPNIELRRGLLSCNASCSTEGGTPHAAASSSGATAAPSGAAGAVSGASAEQVSGEAFERPSLLRLLSVVWLPFAGLVVYAYLTSARKLMLFEMFESEFLGGALASLLMMTVCFLKTDRPLLPLVYRIVTPALIALIMVLGAFPDDSSFRVAALALTYVLFIFLALFAFALFMAVTRAGEFSVPFVYGFAATCTTSVSLGGLVQTRMLGVGDGWDAALWVLTCSFSAIVVVYLGVAAWKGIAEPDETAHYAASLQETLTEKCSSVARRCSLSPRETEILEYLARGYAPAYIAKTLIISVSTARCHVRNIYRKVNVGSREELIQLIDKEA